MIDSIEYEKIITSAISRIVNQKSILYDKNNYPLKPSSAYSYRKDAAKKVGSLKNWTPTKNYGAYAEASERLTIVERSVDLCNNDPHAAGIIQTFASTEIGEGLVPSINFDPDILGIPKEQIREIQKQQKNIYWTWYKYADAGQRLNFGQIQYLVRKSMLKYGEYLVLLPMIVDETRPYALACQIINPMRLKTPSDMTGDDSIRDGVEIGQYGEPIAYWIKKSEGVSGFYLDDSKNNFLRISAKQGHRYKVLHGFVSDDPEQVRGTPFFAPAMKYFKDFNDLLNAELVSNVVTAALSYFIETSTGTDPLFPAQNFATSTDSYYDDSGNSRDVRYQEVFPGQVMYGNTGEKPHLLSAARPGVTFEPFTRIIKKSLAQSLNIPYAVLFKDVENVNFAGFRSAMLDAWRVFSMNRVWMGDNFCQPIYTMLMEEGYLRGQLNITNFYDIMGTITDVDWRGSPKGDIEPIKAIKADILAIENNLKTREEVIAERGGDYRTVFEKLSEEKELLEKLNLNDLGEDGENKEGTE